jgi:hypothetical protein
MRGSAWRLLLAAVFSVCGVAAADSLPTPDAFIQDLRSRRIGLDTFDFAEAGYWNRTPDDRMLWFAGLQQVLASAPRDITSCDDDERRRYVEVFWLMQLVQSRDAETWKARTSAARERSAALTRELAALRPAGGTGSAQVSELRRRFLVDQAVRDPANGARWRADLPPGTEMLWNAIEYVNSIAVDCDNTAWLRAQLHEVGWFDIARFGVDADNAAFYLVQHADRTPEFQREVLRVLEQLPAGETSPRNIAFLTDRVARRASRPQRYGTQGHCTERRTWEPDEIEDVANVDARRARMGLGTLTERIAEMTAECPPPRT